MLNYVYNFKRSQLTSLVFTLSKINICVVRLRVESERVLVNTSEESKLGVENAREKAAVVAEYISWRQC